MTCSADDKDYCGGKNYHATIYFVENTISMSCHRTDVFDQHVYKSQQTNCLGPDCIYYEEESIDRQYNETIIKENPSRNDLYYQCWSRFQCPNDYHIEYYFQYFELSTDKNYIIFFNAEKDIQIQLTGLENAPVKRPELFKWYSFKANEIDFQRRSYYQSKNDKGFKMRVRCARNDRKAILITVTIIVLIMVLGLCVYFARRYTQTSSQTSSIWSISTSSQTSNRNLFIQNYSPCSEFFKLFPSK